MELERWKWEHVKEIIKCARAVVGATASTLQDDIGDLAVAIGAWDSSNSPEAFSDSDVYCALHNGPRRECGCAHAQSECDDCEGTGEVEEPESFQNSWGEHGLKNEPCHCKAAPAQNDGYCSECLAWSDGCKCRHARNDSEPTALDFVQAKIALIEMGEKRGLEVRVRVTPASNEGAK